MKHKVLWLITYLTVLIWSAINLKDYLTWFLEVSPALIGLFILIATYKRFRFVKEIIIRKSIINHTGWMNFFIICFCLALSAFYELIEWWVALLSGESAEAFLGTQGYIWDTQSDMAWAPIGAILSLILLSKIHDNGLKKIPPFNANHHYIMNAPNSHTQ